MKTAIKKTSKRRAKTSSMPNLRMPVASPKLRDGQASRGAQLQPAVPQPSNGAGSVEASRDIDNQTAHAAPDPCAVLKFKQAQRVATIQMQMCLNNKVRSFARTLLRWEWTLPEEDREKLNSAAAELVDALEDGRPVAPERAAIAEVLCPHVLAAMQSRQSFDANRVRIEKDMEAVAQSLPVYKSFVEPIRGMGALGLAIIVGEAGNLLNYANPGKLWKRMGVAPNDAYRMTTKEGKEAIAKPKRRRSTLYTIGDALIKNNFIMEPKTADSKAVKIGPADYRKVYLDRKKYEHARDPVMTKMHAHRRAQRYMEKRLLLNLWKAWRASVA